MDNPKITEEMLQELYAQFSLAVADIEFASTLKGELEHAFSHAWINRGILEIFGKEPSPEVLRASKQLVVQGYFLGLFYGLTGHASLTGPKAVGEPN